jgi:hypothetical protein
MGTENKKESALREINKLINILNSFGNVLVPNLNDKETTALERLEHFVNYLKEEEGLSEEEIELELEKLNNLINK